MRDVFYQYIPLSSISKDDGVSSSCILFPSYKNLQTLTNQLRSSPNTTKTPKKANPTRVSCVKQPSQQIHPPLREATRIEGPPHSPNATDILADLIRIGALQLAEFGVSLDLEVHLLAVLRQHLQQIKHKKHRTRQQDVWRQRRESPPLHCSRGRPANDA